MEDTEKDGHSKNACYRRTCQEEPAGDGPEMPQRDT